MCGKDSMHQLPEMRTISKAYKIIAKLDPNTSLTLTALRRLVNSGELPAIKIGNKWLVNMQTLRKYLTGESFEHSSGALQTTCSIRRVAK